VAAPRPADPEVDMRRLKRGFPAAAAAALVASVLAGGDVGQAASDPAVGFVLVACPDGVFPADADVDCGFVRVPENRAHPERGRIKVAAAVVHTSSEHPSPDPIVFLDGGPSFGAMSPFALDFYFAGADFAADRDIILVDTRGTGFSTPRLGCPELDRARVESFYAGRFINGRALPIFQRALQRCRDRLTMAGVDVAAYNTAESAADLEALRTALGVRRWNLVAISADGVLGLTYMRMFPAGVRSAIIDSGISTQMLWGLDYDRGLVEELERIFAGCRANAACNATYPGIRHAFYALVERLNARPKTIAFPDFRPEPVRLRLDGAAAYADALFSIFPGDRDFPETIHSLLDRIWRETHGELVAIHRDDIGTGPVTNEHVDNFFAQGKSLSYLCHDQIAFVTRGDMQRAARDLPPFAPRYLARGYDMADGFSYPFSPAGCDVWDVGRAKRVQFKPVSSDIPTLVLAGEYDTGVPPYVVRQIPPTLAQATYVEIPASGHLQLASYNVGSDCARAIADDFLDRPWRTPDQSCVDSLPEFDFTPPIGAPRRNLGNGAAVPAVGGAPPPGVGAG
jgi:pimeloyl-ACP methyl ester carboxylesterase